MNVGSLLVYYPFSLAQKVDSASKSRPIEMIRAFEEWGEQEGIRVITITGDSKERAQQFDRLRKSGDLDDLLFCYMENQTIPLWLTDSGHIPKQPLIDLKLFRFLKSKEVPIGVFYRDVYWKFDEIYPLKGVKKAIMKMIYRLEERLYQTYAKVIFLPSEPMFPYINIQKPKVALPPGGKNVIIQKRPSENQTLRGIYVGGIREDTGIPILIKAMEQVQEQKLPFSLTIVCREQEYRSLSEDLRERISNLHVNVKHISGFELQEEYQSADVGFIPFIPNKYNDFAVAFKLFEYLSNEVPIIATECKAQTQIIQSGPYGVICKPDVDDLVEAIQTMIDQHPKYVEEIKRSFAERHSWIARVKTVSQELLGEDL